MSYNALYHHIVYSTKGRRAMLAEDEMARLCEYTVGVIRNLESVLHIANGPADHIHLVVSIAPTISLADFVRTVKTNSSRWIHEAYPQLHDFAWQDGYAAFTVSYSGLEKVIAYVRGQQEHHRKLSFEEELIQFLKKHEVEYDERYIAGG
jgi:putative transposase